jgi:hypothetical protein
LAAAFFAAGLVAAAALAAGFFTSFFAFAVAILVSPSSRDENYAQDLNPSGPLARRIIHRRKRRFALMNSAPAELLQLLTFAALQPRRRRSL